LPPYVTSKSGQSESSPVVIIPKYYEKKQLQLMSDSEADLDKLIFMGDEIWEGPVPDGFTVVDTVDEDKLVANFIAKNPYPDYQSMWSSLPLHLAAEYGEYNHELIKQVYENIHCQQVMKKVGDQIHARGGIQAMQANLTVLKWYSPMAKHMLTQAYCAVDVELAWDGIGTWH
jgi:hypothetical protein